MARKRSAWSIVASAGVFLILLIGRHKNDYTGSNTYESLASQSSAASSMAESIRESYEDARQETITYGEIKGSFDEGLYSNERTGIDLNIPNDFCVASSEDEITLISSELREDSDILAYNELSSDMHFISSQGNAINIDLIYVPGTAMDIPSISALGDSVTEAFTEDRGYTNKETNIEFIGAHMYNTICFDYSDGEHSYKVTILLSVNNDVATVITLIDTNGEDLMSAVTG